MTAHPPRPDLVRDWRSRRPARGDVDRLVEEAGLLRRAGRPLVVVAGPDGLRGSSEVDDAVACGDLVVVDTVPVDALLLDDLPGTADTVDVDRVGGTR
ncbi:MAG TPA: hypothetical protein VFD41_12875, partial [Actinomycetales bacterium]|nr:hypothetical protein [Actinomycetales bacterium]